jgi:PAS domain S-box-containing protein
MDKRSTPFKHSRQSPWPVLDRLEEGIVQLGSQGDILYANPAAVRSLGNPESGVIGLVLLDLMEAQSRDTLREYLESSSYKGPEEGPVVVTERGIRLSVQLLSGGRETGEGSEDRFLLMRKASAEKKPSQRTIQENGELHLLHKILTRARSPLPLEAILPFLLERCVEMLSAEAGSIALLEVEDREQGHLAFRFATGERAETVRGISIPTGQGLIGWCVANDEAAIVNEVSTDSRFFPWVDQMCGFETRSLLCLPIRSDEEVIGAIEIVNKREGDFTEEDLSVLRSWVNVATVNMRTALVQQRLASQRDYYSGIMDSLSEGVLILGRDRTILDVNQFFMMFLNLERAAIIGNTCYSLLKKRDTPCEDCFLDHFRIFKDGKDFFTTLNLSRANGENTHFRVSGTTLEVRDEVIASAVLTYHDITRIQRLNEYLQASASVASLLLKGQGIRGLVGEILEIMGKAAGADRCYWFEHKQNAQGRPVMALQSEWCAQGIGAVFEGSRMRERPYDEGFERWLQRLSSGRVLSGSIEDFPEKERRVLERRNVRSLLLIPLIVGDAYQGYIGFDNCEDDRPWQEAEVNLLQTTADFLSMAFEHESSLNALRESEARYRDIYENIYDSWYLHDMEGRFLEVNPAVERTAGYSEEELLSMSILDLIPERFSKEFGQYLRDLLEKGVAEGLVRIRTKRGEEKNLEYRNWLIQLPDGSTGCRGLVRDVTERINLTSQLKHAQRMESIGTIASGVSHNFRNLLTGIMTNCQLIAMKYRDIPELNRYCNEILKLTHGGSDLIRNLLQFSRKGSHESKAIVNLSEILMETYNIVQPSFDKRVEIQTDWPNLLPIYAEGSSLSQVFLNLCTNARDAMPNGGTLTIEAERKGRMIHVRFTDTGVGMDQATLEKIYDPFFTTKEPGKGTGLGLSTAYGIVKQHGGDIRIVTELHKGTQFEVLLPTPDTITQGETQESPRIVKGNGQKILIVDDDETILKPMIELIEGLGYKASAVTDGHQAVQTYMSWRPDVVLLDRSMPGIDGLQTALNIMEIDPKAWIILISGYDEYGPDGVDSRIQDSLKGYITKPFDIGKVSQVLAEVLMQ